MSRIVTNGLAEGNDPEFCLVKTWCAIYYGIEPTLRFYRSNGFSSVEDRGNGSWAVKSHLAFPDRNAVCLFGGERTERRSVEGMLTIRYTQGSSSAFFIKSYDNDEMGASNPTYVSISIV